MRRILDRFRALAPQALGTRKAARRLQQIWSIGVFVGTSPFDLKDPDVIDNPVLTHRDVTDVPASFVADPFMIRVGDQWYMFFEVMNRQSGKGEIGLASSPDGTRWTYHHIVLAEPFHLSYPYVFHVNDEYYMVPESHLTLEVRLYRATEFPMRWSHVATLVEGAEFVDASVCRFNDRWWLFAGVGSPPFRAESLRLFTGVDLMGRWVEHPQSPIVKNDGQIARPAGRILVWGDGVVRYAQDCRLAYGMQVHAFETITLTADAYSERPVSPSPLLTGSGKGWNHSGMHHVDPHALGDGNWMASVDGWVGVYE